MAKRLSNLLSVKSIVTILQTLLFCYLCMFGSITTDFLTIYTMIISFYFGSQLSRKQEGEL